MSLTEGWRRSRVVAAAARVPFLGDLPVGLLEAVLQRGRRAYYAAAEVLLRLAAWLRTVSAWGRSEGPVQPEWRALLRRSLQRDLLHLCFSPSAMRGRPRLLASSVSLESARAALASTTPQSGDAPRRAIVYCSSEGNFFHAEMAELLARGLGASGGFDVQRQDELAEPGDADLHLVSAPHEFFALGAGARFAGARYRAFRRRCSLFLAEQPGSKHFALCLPFAAEARRVFDLNAASAVALRRMGFDARFLPVTPLVDESAGEAPELEAPAVRGMSLAAAAASSTHGRPVDVLFLGVLTQRRADFFSRHAGFFAARRCVLSLPTRFTPLRRGVASTLDTAEANTLCARSKILLNVHRDESPYFEWHRIVIRGLAQKGLVVSEPSELPPGFVSGTHLLEAPLSEIPDLLHWLLESEDGRRKADEVREAGYRLLTEQYDMRVWARALAASLATPGVSSA